MIDKFHFYCQKVLPIVYDDSLSYYETLCKISEKLNEVIDTQNNLGQEWLNLKAWIDTQLETYAKDQLQNWLDDGTLANIINEQLFNELNTKVNLLISRTPVHMSDYVIPNGNDDNTALMQQAIDAAAGKVLVIDGSANPYRCNQLTLHSNSIYVCEPNTIIKANDTWITPTLWQAPLIDFRQIQNVKWFGNNATITMNKPATPTVEHAHCMGTRGASDVYIENMILSNASGDGFYIDQYDADETNAPSHDVTIKNLYCDNNARQGMSIVSGYNLLIQDCIFTNTKGLAPQSGMDIEAELRSPNMSNIKIEGCQFINNTFAGLIVSGIATSISTPIEVFINNCAFTGALMGININALKSGMNGSIKADNCHFYNTRYNAILDYNNSNNAVVRTFSNCTIVNANSAGEMQNADTVGEAGWASACQVFAKDSMVNGNVYFFNCTVSDTNATPKCLTAFAFCVRDTARVTGAGVVGCTSTNIPKPLLGFGIQLRDITHDETLPKPENREVTRTVDTSNYYQIFRSGTLTLGPCLNKHAIIEFYNADGPASTLKKGSGVSIYPGNPTTITLPSIGSRIYLKSNNGYDFFIISGVSYTNN